MCSGVQWWEGRRSAAGGVDPTSGRKDANAAGAALVAKAERDGEGGYLFHGLQSPGAPYAEGVAHGASDRPRIGPARAVGCEKQKVDSCAEGLEKIQQSLRRRGPKIDSDNGDRGGPLPVPSISKRVGELT